MTDEIKNYENIDIPYNTYLSRGEITTPESSLDSSNGTKEEEIKSGDSLNDIWIRNFIRSENWSPKKKGFYIDGLTGYAEFSNVFISGNIEALTGTIGGFTIGATSLSAVSGGNTTTLSSGATAFSAGATGTPTVTITQAGIITATGAIIDGTSTLGGRLASTIATAIDSAGAFINANLDTSAKTILGSFTFGVSGALQIGTYSAGVSGDVKISPSGIVGRNSAGANTFTIDGTTGTATFAGTLSAAAGTLGAVTAGTFTGITIAIGTANNIFKADSNGIYLGNATFASAPFSVSMAGAVMASNLTITGGSITIGSNSSIDSSGNATFIGVSSLNMKAYTSFETAGRFISTVGGSGTNSFGNQGVTISPGATATSYSRLLWRISNNVYGNNPTFVVTITALSLNASSNEGQAFIGLGAPTVSGSAFGFNNSHIGFWIKKVSGVVTVASEQNDGTVGGNVGANIFTIVDNDVIELFIKVTSANVKYYYRKNSGTLTLGDTQTTRLPTGSDEYISFSTTNLDNAINFSFQIFCAAYEH